MIVYLFVFILMQINAAFEKEVPNVPDSICSRVVATPSGKTEPMIFGVDGQAEIFGVAKPVAADIIIVDNKCIMNGASIGEPCFNETGFVNITINDASKFDTVAVFSKDACVATFAPKCLFKPVEPGNTIPELSFPFARFQNGNDSVTINFSLKKSDSSFDSTLYRNGDVLCSWVGTKVNQTQVSHNCKDFTDNTKEGRLDFILEYKRKDSEEITNFLFGTKISAVGVSVYWTKEGESPDVVECKRVNALTTSSGCSIGFTFTILFGIAQWIFK